MAEEKESKPKKAAKLRPQDGPHDILKPITYGNPDHPLHNSVVMPGTEQLPFSHLTDGQYNTVLRMRLIAPVKE